MGLALKFKNWTALKHQRRTHDPVAVWYLIAGHKSSAQVLG